MSKRNRQTLSRNLLKMKFMQKSKEKNEKEMEELLVDEELNDNLRKEGEKYIISSSHVFCEELRFGRMSFRGMNQEIEKVMKEMNEFNDNNNNDNKDRGLEVSDEEMTNRYSNLIDSNPSRQKRAKFSHKNKFNKRFKN